MTESQPNIYNVTEQTYAELVLKASHQQPILVDFWADWCSPCLVLAPALEGVINEENGRIRLAKVEVDDNMRLAGQYRLRGFPTVVGFINGEEIARFASAKPKPWIREFIQAHFPAA